MLQNCQECLGSGFHSELMDAMFGCNPGILREEGCKIQGFKNGKGIIIKSEEGAQ